MDITHLALFLQSKGWIGKRFCRNRKEGYYQPIISISSTDVDLLGILRREFGGCLRGPYQHKLTKRGIWKLEWWGKQAKLLAEALLPHMEGARKDKVLKLLSRAQAIPEHDCTKNLSRHWVTALGREAQACTVCEWVCE